MNQKVLVVLLCYCITISESICQTFDEFFPRFSIDGKLATFGALGGIGAGQFSSIDLDNDGRKDLFVFDRQANSFITFLNKGSAGEIKYEYTNQYKNNFPNLQGWVLLYDFNKDGIEDIFTLPLENVAGISVWRGHRDAQGLYFSQMKFEGQSNYLLYLSANLYHSIIDYPSILDVDGDGDTDVLTFEQEGRFLSYYKNLAVENGLGIDTFDMSLGDLCFGKFREDGLDASIYLSNDAGKCNFMLHSEEESGGPRHAGSTVLALDRDCDQDMDLILGDLSTEKLIALYNDGTRTDAWMQRVEVDFPENDVSADIKYFVAAFHLDANNDGKRDLIVTPNQSGENVNHVWLYLNSGSDCAPVFTLETKNFLVENMVTVGGYSSIEAVDVDADGLKDLIIGGNQFYSNNEQSSGLNYFKNTGTATQPEFNLVDDDFANISLNYNIRRLTPVFGDMDGDEDLDMLVGEASAGSVYFENAGGKGEAMSFGNSIYPYFNIRVGQNSAPVIFDVNKDGLNDLIFGEEQFEIQYFQNYGTVTEAKFYKNGDTLSNFREFGLVYTVPNSDLSGGRPDVFTSEGKDYMLQGVRNSGLRLFGELKQDAKEKIDLIDSNFGGIDPGFYGDPKMADIDNDNFYELILGDAGGAIRFFNTEIKVQKTDAVNELTDGIQINMYPNPVRDILHIYSTEGTYNFSIKNAHGVTVLKGDSNESQTLINCKQFMSGVYYVFISARGTSIIKKIIILE